MEFEDMLNSEQELSAEELAELMAMERASGKAGQVTFIDDPDSPEGQAAKEYVNSYHWLPSNYRTLLRQKVQDLCKPYSIPAYEN